MVYSVTLLGDKLKIYEYGLDLNSNRIELKMEFSARWKIATLNWIMIEKVGTINEIHFIVSKVMAEMILHSPKTGKSQMLFYWLMDDFLVVSNLNWVYYSKRNYVLLEPNGRSKTSGDFTLVFELDSLSFST